MLIESMTQQASLALLDRTRLARLGCAHDGQPYIVPMTFAHDADCLYSFSTFGQAISWTRVNPKVCVEVDDWSPDGSELLLDSLAHYGK